MVDRKEIVVDGITYVQKEPTEPDLMACIHGTTLNVRKHPIYDDEIAINFGIEGDSYRYDYTQFNLIIDWFERVRDAYFPGGKRFDA